MTEIAHTGLRFRNLPRRLFLDSNLIVSLALTRSPNHIAASRTFTELVAAAHDGRASLYVSPLVLDEVWWKLGELLYDDAHGQEHAWRRLPWGRRKEALEQHAGTIVPLTRLILEGGLITVTEVRPEDVLTALQYAVHAAEPHLAPRDALHLAVMKRLGIEGIVTNDPDFANAPGIVVIRYSDL